MDESQLRQQLLAQFGLRLRPAMLRYLLDRLSETRDAQPIAILGADARTGVAVRRLLAREELMGGPRRSAPS